jgi:hypothetical protein
MKLSLKDMGGLEGHGFKPSGLLRLMGLPPFPALILYPTLALPPSMMEKRDRIIFSYLTV